MAGSRALRVLKRIGIGLGGIVVLAVAFGAACEQWARHSAAKDFPPRGQLVDIGGRKLHLDCRGSGSPTVILESGVDPNGTLSWRPVHDSIARITRTCAYDRAGIMWSDDKSGPHDGEGVARDLHAMLEKAGIGGPLVLVGLSAGGPYAMTYTRLYGDDVKGIVFVDASHADQGKKLPPPGRKAYVELPFVPRAMSALAWTGIWRLVPAQAAPGEPPAEAGARQAYMGHSIGGVIAEMDALPAIWEQAGKLRNLGDRPVVVLTSTQPYPPEMLQGLGVTKAEGEGMQARWKALHAEIASWSTRSRQELVPDAGHYIQNERPDVVVRAVDEVVKAVRADAVKAPAAAPAT